MILLIIYIVHWWWARELPACLFSPEVCEDVAGWERAGDEQRKIYCRVLAYLRMIGTATWDRYIQPALVW